ncbi:MAG: hypothetical protein AAB242_11635 [Nitrospirota bacterium]
MHQQCQAVADEEIVAIPHRHGSLVNVGGSQPDIAGALRDREASSYCRLFPH